MTHALILLACLVLAWGLAAVALRIAPRLAAPGDRRAVHQLALFAPLLALGLAGGWAAEMALGGCPMFTPADRWGTLALLGCLAAGFAVSAVRETSGILRTRRQLEAIAGEATGLAVPLAALAAAVGVALPTLRFLETERAIACVAGVVRPTLFVSRGMVEALSERELEGLLAHELAHVRHLDNLLAWLDVILLRTFRFLPPLQAAWLESLAEREEYADAVAARATRRPRALASALLKLAELPNETEGTLVGAAHFAAPTSLLERRVERLLALPEEGGRTWGWPAVAALATALALPFLTAWGLGAYTTCLIHLPGQPHQGHPAEGDAHGR